MKTTSADMRNTFRDGFSSDRLQQHLLEVAIPRVPNTKGSEKVKEYIENFLKRNLSGWEVTTDEFVDTTPQGLKKFSNILATYGPSGMKSKNQIFLACHYDSKWFKEPNGFIGATDSAVSVAMLIDIAEYVSGFNSSNKRISLIFFDGEEAFEEWSETDSLYGARHLASKMMREGVLRDIKLFVLLDLLGASSPRIYSMFPATNKYFRTLLKIEKRLKHLFPLEFTGLQTIFQEETGYDYRIEDDHTPFLKYGVNTLHLIPVPFPNFWHTVGDNLDVVDLQTTKVLTVIIKIFLAEISGLHKD